MHDVISDLEFQVRSDPYNPAHHIALAKAYLEEGDEERARKIVAIKRRLPSKDPSIHYEWGQLCEELGMARQALESYEQALALDPANPDYHFRVAFLYYEKGGWERTLKHLQKTVSLAPENTRAQNLLGSLYEEMGFGGLAKILKGKDDRKVEMPSSVIPSGPTVKDLALFLDLFIGREFGYAKFFPGTAGSLFLQFVKGVLGGKEIMEHLRGENALGVYPLRSNQTLKLCAIHIRIPWRRLVANIRNSGFLAISEDQVQQYARKIAVKAGESGLSAYIENQGDRERKVWFFFEEFIPFELSQRLLDALLDKVPAPGMDLSVIPLLGYRAAGIGHEDYPIMLPLGTNPRTGNRSYFTDDEGIPFDDQLLFLNKIRAISRNGIMAVLKAGTREAAFLSHHPLKELKHLQEQCPVLDEIVRKAGSGRNLRHEEKLVLYFVLGFLSDGAELLHHVLEPCPDYRPKKVARVILRLGHHPVSCPKIRHLLPEVTAYLRCECSFDLIPGEYPSPLLHVFQRITMNEGESTKVKAQR